METAPQRFTQVAPLYRREARDAFPVVAAVHALAAELAVPHLTEKDFKAMRAANRRFAEALKDNASTPPWPRTTPSTRSSSTSRANGEIPRVLDRLMPRVRRLERMRFGSLAGPRLGAASTTRIIAAAAAADVRQDRRAGSRELALPRNPHRPELRMTATTQPDVHDPETLATARALLDAATGPREMQQRGAATRSPATSAGAATSASTCSRPRRSSARRSRSSSPPRSARERPKATSARSTAGSRARSTSTRSRRWPSSCSRSSSRPTTPSTAWWRA